MTGEADSRRNVSRETQDAPTRGPLSQHAENRSEHDAGRVGGLSETYAAGDRDRLIHRRLRLTGRVQGVGMRWYAVTRAEELGLDGWVRNRLDGSVDMQFQGEPQAVEKMTDLMRRGAPYSRIADVDQTDLPVDKGLQGRGFTVLYDRRGW